MSSANSMNNLEDTFANDNTLFSLINLEDSKLLETNATLKSTKISKSQKFGALSLTKNNTDVSLYANKLKNGTKGTSKRAHETSTNAAVLEKKTKTEFVTTKDNFDNQIPTIRSKSDSILEVSCASSNKPEYDAFASYLRDDISQLNPNKSRRSEFSQILNKTPAMKQIDNVQEPIEHLSKNNNFKTPKPTFNSSLNDKLKEVFNSSTVGDLEIFFDQVEKSISHNGEIVENKAEKISQIMELACIKANDSVIESQDINGRNLSDVSLQNISAVECSFATSLKQILMENGNREVVQLEHVAAATPNKNSQFKSLGPFYGLPAVVKKLIKLYKGFDELYDWQDECLNLPAIANRKNLIYALPTSGGKTLVAEILMLRELLCNRRNTILVLPFVAIVQEKVWALSPFGVALGFLVEEYAASKGIYPPRKRRRKNSIFICTIEKALGLINSLIETERIDEIGQIVVDELHLVGEQGRGSTLEALLTKVMAIKSNIQIIGMSATIGNVKDICGFLDAELYEKNFRPVELIEYVKCGDEIAKINFSKKDEELMTVARKTDFLYTSEQKALDPDGIGGLVMEIIPKESCLIFCATKKNCENVAYLLCKVLKRTYTDHEKEKRLLLINQLKKETQHLCKILRISIQFGIAYHHSGLTNEERYIIEDGFRQGILCVICCTSTLAAGVNLPAKRVILRQPYVGMEFINLSRYKQMIGRAGRAGFGEAGDSILMCTTRDLPKVKDLLMSPMDQALSDLHSNEGMGLRHLLLSMISLGLANTRQQLQEVSKKTLLYIQSKYLEVDVKKITDRIISELFKLGALEEADLTKPENDAKMDITVQLENTLPNLSMSILDEPQATSHGIKKRKVIIKNNTKLIVSKLGRAAIKGGFELTRAHMLYDDLTQAQKSFVLVDCLHLLYLITPYDIADQIRPNKNDYFNIYCKLNSNELQTARVLGITESVAMRFLSNKPILDVPERVINRFYLTLMLYDLWNENSVFEVSEKYQISRGIVQNLITASSTFASNVVHFCDGLEEFWTFAQLLRHMSQRLSYCCVKELIPLMELPAVKESRAKQLYNAGFKTLPSIAKASEHELVEAVEHLPIKVAKQLIAAAKMLLLEKIENLREEAKDVCEGLGDNFFESLSN